VTVTLLEPNKQREDRAQQIDLRFSKLVRLGRARVRGRFDIYNLTNADDVTSQIQTIQTNFRRPSTIIPGRTFKFGANVEF
jgi:outer membrane receptor protein involved in Fe transport